MASQRVLDGLVHLGEHFSFTTRILLTSRFSDLLIPLVDWKPRAAEPILLAGIEHCLTAVPVMKVAKTFVESISLNVSCVVACLAVVLTDCLTSRPPATACSK